jgi:hypothetical protein
VHEGGAPVRAWQRIAGLQNTRLIPSRGTGRVGFDPASARDRMRQEKIDGWRLGPAGGAERTRSDAWPSETGFMTQKRRRAIAAFKRLAMARLRLARARGWSRASPSLVFCLPGKPRRFRLPVTVHPRRLWSSPDPWGPLCFLTGSLGVFGTVRACASLGGLVLFVLCPCCGLRRRAPDWFFVCCVSRYASLSGPTFSVDILKSIARATS